LYTPGDKKKKTKPVTCENNNHHWTLPSQMLAYQIMEVVVKAVMMLHDRCMSQCTKMPVLIPSGIVVSAGGGPGSLAVD